ncbi:hypothetical protein FRC06_004247 [Ceratobasidium sp. 370]|nr:hypothetical protein FRC06_004247 [Ceratobasidium sp. 370]
MSTLPSTDPCAGNSPGFNVVLVSNLTESTEHVTMAPGLVQSPLPTAPTNHMHSEASSEIIQASEEPV